MKTRYQIIENTLKEVELLGKALKATRVLHRTDADKMVAHVWAQQKQSEGRSANGSIYFEGDTIYSYGRHFPMARIVGDSVLFTSRGYSNTTAKHLGHARRAISHMDIIYVHNVEENAEGENFSQFEKEINSLIKQFERAKGRKPVIMGEIESTIESANAYAKFIKSKRKFSIPKGKKLKELQDQAQAERLVDATRNKARKERDAKILEDRKKELQEYLDRWEAGVGAYLGGFHKLPVRLRINGDKLQTSHGAECPLKFGKRAYLQAKICKAKNITWVSNGHTIKLGHFQIDTITASGTIVAGCHIIPFEETLRIARKAGWVK